MENTNTTLLKVTLYPQAMQMVNNTWGNLPEAEKLKMADEIVKELIELYTNGHKK